MSLLMKALEKAAKERDNGENGLASSAGGTTTTSGLTLEPIASAPSGATRETMTDSTRAQTPPGTRAPTANAASGAAQAAALIRAGERGSSGGPGAYLREHPLMAFSAFAALFMVAYGSYVYLQMTNPGLFVKQPARPQGTQSTPLTALPPPATSPAASQPAVALTTLLPPMQAGAENEKPAVQSAATVPAPVIATPAAPTPAAVAPTAPAPTSAGPAAPVLPPPQAPRDTIRVTGGGGTPAVNPVLTEAYQALSVGNFESAQRLYNVLLRSDARSIDALLGLAAIATQQGDSAQATAHYMKILEIDPQSALAQAGLIGMLGRADPLAAETRLKQLIAREPSAYLYFTLGNIFADQNR